MPNVIEQQVTRRSFLQVSTGALGGLVASVYFHFPLLAEEVPPLKYPPDAFVAIHRDGKIVIQVNRVEIGQGINTALPMVLADELDADWSQVVAELAPADDVYKDPMRGLQMVGGSGSVRTSFTQYRELGARVRAMLIAAAAQRWNVAPEKCTTEASVVHGPGGQSAKYGDLATEAAKLPVPATVSLKDPSQFRLIGKPTRRLDSRAKADGSQKFGIDVDLPNMLVAVVAHPPVFGATVTTMNSTEIRKMDGVKDLFSIPTVRDGQGVAIVADSFWAAKRARDELSVEWDFAGRDLPDSDALWNSFHQLGRKPGIVAEIRGEKHVLSTVDTDSDRLIAEYEFPYLAHAPLEPENLTVRFDGDKAEAWGGSQLPGVERAAIAETLGLKPGQVVYHTQMTGGGFGRRAVPDAHVAREAAQIAKHMRGTPIKLIWTREDDLRGGYYRPMHVHHADIAVGNDGLPRVWRHVVVGQALMSSGDKLDSSLVDGVADTPYQIPNFHVSGHHPNVNVPVLWWRSVGHTHTAFVMETLIDELAMRAHADPFAYRRKLLDPKATKLRAALDLLDEESRWREQVPSGHAVGVASHYCFQSAVACAAEVSVEDGRLWIHRVTAAVACGRVVNPLGLEAQVEGGLTFGLSQLVSRGEITLKNGHVEQDNFNDYRPPAMADAPLAIDVHFVRSEEAPTGIGEPPVPVIAPAVVNALARLTGKRYRSLPLKEI